MTDNHRAIAPRPTEVPTEAPTGTGNETMNPIECVLVGNTIFPSLTQALRFIDTLPREEQYPHQLWLLAWLMQRKEKTDEQVAALYGHVRRTAAWTETVSPVEFDQQWEEAKQVEEQVQKRNDEITRIRGKVSEIWGQANTDHVWEFVHTLWMAQQVRKVANRRPVFETFVTAMNRAIIGRVSKPGPGHRKGLHPIVGDMTAVLQLSKVQEVTQEEAKNHGLRFNQHGILVSDSKPVSPPLPVVTPARPRASTDVSMRSVPVSPSLAVAEPVRTVDEQNPTSTDVVMGGQEPAAPHTTLKDVGEALARAVEVGMQEKLGASSDCPANSPAIEGQSTDQSEAAEPSATPAAPNVPHSALVATIAGQQAVVELDTVFENAEDYEDLAEYEETEETAQKKAKVKQGQCGCQLPKGLIRDIASKKPVTLAISMRLLRRMFEAIPEPDSGQVCYAHMKLLGAKIGLKTGTLKFNPLLERLAYCFHHRGEIGDIRASNDRHDWFRRDMRPSRPEDALGVYKFTHLVPAPDVAKAPPNSFANAIRITGVGMHDRDTIATASEWQREWTDTGNVVVLGLMSWWSTNSSVSSGEPILEIVRREMDMYQHHLREINGRPNYGWLRCMYHGLAQQLMRQDPAYYYWYVLLRPDHNYRLISYPYYGKYTNPGDSTYFRHIDINIANAVRQDKAVNLIQGSLTLDDEDQGNCTEILPGMHQHLGELLERHPSLETDGCIQKITADAFTTEDEEHFGITWTKVICKAGDVRITMPTLPHGSTGPATRVRRTLLPWYVGIQEDHSTLDVLESGTWEELAAAHCSLTAASSSPSGHTNRYGCIPYRFPPALPLEKLGSISDALVGRCRWDDIDVVRDLNILFGSDIEAAREYIMTWRENATRQFAETWRQVVRREKDYFGDYSYFDGDTAPTAHPLGPELENELRKTIIGEEYDHY